MRRAAINLLSVMLLLAAQSLFAQTTGTGEAIVQPLSSGLASSEMATVLTGKGRPAECLAPLEVTRVDGRPAVVPAQGFLIAPGVHTLNGRATLDLSYCPLGDPGLRIGNVADLEVDFEAGNTYYIGFYHPPDKLDDWKLVVWNIE